MPNDDSYTVMGVDGDNFIVMCDMFDKKVISKNFFIIRENDSSRGCVLLHGVAHPGIHRLQHGGELLRKFEGSSRCGGGWKRHCS